ncbi:hypothetical protein LXT21_35465 [Myxococcus sp. K38C18041901]|uniref:hypothetical protein n=1 Tax=Myxococcus guangdongensis TaxID=2906760 RepID=UPI0020A7FA44|nr:hypothetical protein [Myxococcus guangdongensis]MCP3064085.1 hypothetical protein [Myxococcus guangdongensis]
MDYRKFLGKVESAVLPYLGGGTVDTATRRLRVTSPVAPGWWRFELKGREATAREPAGPEGLEALPRVRGHVWGARLVLEGAVARPLELMPEDEPSPLAPVSARRWHDGALLFDGVEFEGEAEDAARRALEEGQPLASVKGVSAPLRAAFGYALLEATSRVLDIRFAPAETRGRVLKVAELGRPEAESCLRALAEERRTHQRVLEARRMAEQRRARDEAQTVRATELAQEARRRVLSGDASWGRGAPVGDHSRAEVALQGAGARLLHHRRMAGSQLEVTFSFMGERFVSIVDARTLQVMDAGVCLAGADSEVTLESLPSVIREAIDTDVLVITRHA